MNISKCKNNAIYSHDDYDEICDFIAADKKEALIVVRDVAQWVNINSIKSIDDIPPPTPNQIYSDYTESQTITDPKHLAKYFSIPERIAHTLINKGRKASMDDLKVKIKNSINVPDII